MDQKDLLGKLASYGPVEISISPQDPSTTYISPPTPEALEEAKSMRQWVAAQQAAQVGGPIAGRPMEEPPLYVLQVFRGGCYQWILCASSEEALESIRKEQTAQGTLQIALYSLEDSWRREWKKR